MNESDAKHQKFLKFRAQKEFAVREHIKFLRGKLDFLENCLNKTPEGVDYYMVASDIGTNCSPVIPMIVQELMGINNDYNFWRK